jgi:Uma2 family endonuclease
MNLHAPDSLLEDVVVPKGYELIDGRLVEKHGPRPDSDEPILESGCEFIDGRVVEKPMGWKASRVISRLTRYLDEWVEEHNLGHVLEAEAGYQIFPDTRKIRKPDVSFIPRGRLPQEELPPGNGRICPDLVGEVISPNDLAEDIEQRVADFFGAGAKLFWIVYPATRSIQVVRTDGTAARLTEQQSLSGENIIPGFTLPLTTLFAGI